MSASFLPEFIHTEVFSAILQYLAILSLVTFLLSLVLIPIIVGRIRKNFFLILDRKISIKRKPTIKQYLLVISRNLAGWFLVIAGFAMLFLPGQGLITLLMGLTVITFPGKHRLFRYLVRKEKLQKALNWIRIKRKAPFLWPSSEI